MRVLAITYAFAPLRYPATFRLTKWFKGLDELGHEVTVVSVHPATFRGPKDETLGELVPGNVTNVQVRSPETTLVYRLLRLRELWFYRLLFPWKMEWYRPALRRLRALDLESYDVVLSCSQPTVCHLLGLELKRTVQLPWVAYFSDPWVDNPYAHYPTQRIRDRNVSFERSVIGGADRLVFPSPEMRDQISRKYGPGAAAKSEVLPHCYVPEWYGRAPRAEPRERDSIRILLTGNFYGPRTPIPFLEKLQELTRGSGAFSKVSVDIYGQMGSEYLSHPVWKELGSLVRFCGSAGYLDSLAMMKDADYLLLIDADTGEGRESIFFPSKLADYLGSGNPIVGLTPSRGVSTRVLRETGNIVCSGGDDARLTSILLDMLKGKLLVDRNEAKIASYDYRPVARTLEGILRESSAGPPEPERRES
jgi:glycosyltransferase involved in cell wall biosynthesis